MSHRQSIRPIVQLSKKLEELNEIIQNVVKKFKKSSRTCAQSGEVIFAAFNELDKEYYAKMSTMNNSTIALNTALDSTINARVASDVQKVCNMPIKQDNHVKLTNVTKQIPVVWATSNKLIFTL